MLTRNVRLIDVLVEMKNGNGPLALASQKGHLNTLGKLIGMGLKADGHHQVIERERFQRRWSFLNNAQNGFTALHWACHEGHAQTAEFLILSGASIDALHKVLI